MIKKIVQALMETHGYEPCSLPLGSFPEGEQPDITLSSGDVVVTLKDEPHNEAVRVETDGPHLLTMSYIKHDSQECDNLILGILSAHLS